MRLNVMERDGWMCGDCNSKEKQLTVHHTYYEKGNPWDTSPDFLITLCWDCHKARERAEERIKRALGLLFASYIQQLSEGDWLDDFATSLEDQLKEVQLGDRCVDEIRITDDSTLEYKSDVRWFHYAYDNPSGRPMYVAVTGYNPWKKKKGDKK